MDSFSLYLPTRIIFGPSEMDKLGLEARKFGTKALLVKTLGPLEKLGVYARAKKLMEKEGMTVYELNDVEPNPKLRSVYEGGRICKENGVDIVIAVGGGSATDCAKAVAMAAKDDGDVWDFFEDTRKPASALPIGAVSTIAATGAEMSIHCVITNEKTHRKLATHYDFTYPKFAIVDPVLHTSVPRGMTASGMVDTITHVMESYFENRGQPLSDRIAEGVTLTVMESEGILDNLHDVNKRADLAWAAIMAINSIADAGRSSFIYGAHEIAHGISAVCDTVHGVTLSVIHPAWLEHMCAQGLYTDKFIQFAERIYGIKDKGNGIETGLKSLKKLKETYLSWGMPNALRDIGVEKEKFEEIAESTVANPIGLLSDKNEVIGILERCY